MYANPAVINATTELKDRLLQLPAVQALQRVSQRPNKKFDVYDTALLHTEAVVEQSQKMFPESKVLLVASVLHDIGKIKCNVVKDNHVSFPGHAGLSMEMADPILDDLVFGDVLSTEEAADVLLLINHHMRPRRGGETWTLRAANRFRKKFGSKLEILMKFADLNTRGRTPESYPDDIWTPEIQLLDDTIAQLR